MGRKEEVAQRLRTMRKSRGYTQRDLAKLMGVSPSSISMYETGERGPDFETLESFADVFNVSLSDIIGDDIVEIETGHAGPNDDDDAWELRERLRRDSDMRLLFDAARKASPEHIRAAAAMLKALEPEEFTE